MKSDFEETTVKLELSYPEYNSLMLFLGFSVGVSSSGDRGIRNDIIKFVNKMNEGNRHYTPYKVGAENENKKK